MSQLWGYVNMSLLSALNVWYAVEAGQADDRDWTQANNHVTGTIDFGVGRVIWAHGKYSFPPPFVAEIDAALNTGETMAVEHAWHRIMADVGKLKSMGAGDLTTKE